MTIGTSKNSARSTGPTLSPKENIKKFKIFGCKKIDENKMECSSKRPVINSTSTMVTTASPASQASQATPASQASPAPPATSAQPATPINSKTSTCDEGDYAIMNPVLGRRIVVQQPAQPQPQPIQHSIATVSGTKKTALVTTDPDKVMANTQVKTNNDGFKPITSRADKEVSQQLKSTSTNSNSTFNRQHSAPVEKHRKPSNDNSGYELLELRSSSSSHSMGGRIARPNSVNSEKTTFTPLMRPNSANSERHSTSTFSLTSTPLNETGTQSVSVFFCFSFCDVI